MAIKKISDLESGILEDGDYILCEGTNQQPKKLKYVRKYYRVWTGSSVNNLPQDAVACLPDKNLSKTFVQKNASGDMYLHCVNDSYAESLGAWMPLFFNNSGEAIILDITNGVPASTAFQNTFETDEAYLLIEGITSVAEQGQ